MAATIPAVRALTAWGRFSVTTPRWPHFEEHFCGVASSGTASAGTAVSGLPSGDGPVISFLPA